MLCRLFSPQRFEHFADLLLIALELPPNRCDVELPPFPEIVFRHRGLPIAPGGLLQVLAKVARAGVFAEIVPRFRGRAEMHNPRIIPKLSALMK